MSEPVPVDKTVVVTPNLSGLRTLTFVSLGLNGLILFLLVVGAIIHHHHERREMGGWQGRGEPQGFCPMEGHRGGFGGNFHRFGGGFGPGQGNGRFEGCPGGEDQRFGDDREKGNFGRGPGGPEAPGGGPGFFGRGPGDKNGPPDPARMTDGILGFLTMKLALTDDQKAKIKPIVEQQVTDIQKQMETQRAAMQKQIEDAKAKIKPLLNADQQKQLDALPLPGQKPAVADQPKPDDKPAK